MGLTWVVVVSPRGDTVRLDRYYDQFQDGRSLFGMGLTGKTENGTSVTVRGNHVALAWREEEAKRPRVGLTRFER